MHRVKPGNKDDFFITDRNLRPRAHRESQANRNACKRTLAMLNAHGFLIIYLPAANHRSRK